MPIEVHLIYPPLPSYYPRFPDLPAREKRPSPTSCALRSFSSPLARPRDRGDFGAGLERAASVRRLLPAGPPLHRRQSSTHRLEKTTATDATDATEATDAISARASSTPPPHRSSTAPPPNPGATPGEDNCDPRNPRGRRRSLHSSPPPFPTFYAAAVPEHPRPPPVKEDWVLALDTSEKMSIRTVLSSMSSNSTSKLELPQNWSQENGLSQMWNPL